MLLEIVEMRQLEELQAQDTAKKILESYLSSYPPALLILHGPPGVGKHSAAECFIREFLCSGPKGCMDCFSCRKMLRKEHADYIRFPEKTIPIGSNKNPEVFTIRWLLEQRIAFPPIDGEVRFVLFPDQARMQHEAETALLKVLEEPPYHTRFILLVSHLSELRSTILSRGICIPFRLLAEEKLARIAKLQDPLALACLGGSLAKLPLLGSKLYVLMKTKIEESFRHPLDLVALEKWLMILENPKSLSKEIEIEIQYTELLDFFALLFLALTQKHSACRDIAQVIFAFKRDLHLQMQGVNPYILASFFTKMQRLLFS